MGTSLCSSDAFGLLSCVVDDKAWTTPSIAKLIDVCGLSDEQSLRTLRADLSQNKALFVQRLQQREGVQNAYFARSLVNLVLVAVKLHQLREGGGGVVLEGPHTRAH